MYVSEITCQEEHVVRVGPGLRDPRPQDPGTMRLRTHNPSLIFKSGTKGLPSKFKSGAPGPLSKFKIGTHIMVFLHCFAYYILHEKLINFFKEIIFYNSLQAVFFVLNSFTISLKTLSFIFESMSHLVCLIRRRGSFGGGGRDFYRKQINEGSN